MPERLWLTNEVGTESLVAYAGESQSPTLGDKYNFSLRAMRETVLTGHDSNLILLTESFIFSSVSSTISCGGESNPLIRSRRRRMAE
jgi:hypothetical protein